MLDNTPPRLADIEDDFEEVYDNDGPPPDDDDDLEMAEITLEELQSRIEAGGDYEISDDESGPNIKAPEQDDSILTFQRHTAPVFACAMHPHLSVCATGGEDDKVYVWNRSNGEVIQEIAEHKDTVTEVHFNHDGTYLASCDLAGKMLLHKLVESSGSGKATKEEGITLQKVWEYTMGDMSWMRWHKAANVLVAGSEDGEIYVFRLPGGDCKILPGQSVRCEAGEITNDGKKLFASYSNGTVKLWDIKSTTVLMEINEQNPIVHQEGTSTVACDKESPLYMSGDEDGKIIFSTPNGPVGMVQANGAVECLAFSPSTDFRMAASGTLHGQVAIWDHSKLSLRTECEHADNGITKIQWISDFTILVSTLQGNVIAYDARTGERKFTLSGHWMEIYSFCYDQKENLLLTVSEDNSCKIFKVPELGD